MCPPSLPATTQRHRIHDHLRTDPPICTAAGQIPFTSGTVPIWGFCA